MNALLLEYSRIPKTVTYVAAVKHVSVDVNSREFICLTVLKEMTGVSLEKVIEELHYSTKDLPHELIFIMQTAYQEKSERLPKMYEVGETLMSLIRNDLSKAQAAFAPITDWRGKSHEQPTQ